MIFVGSKVFTHARYWQIKKCVCIIFCGGGGGGGAPRICGGGGARAPQAPRSYAPGWKENSRCPLSKVFQIKLNLSFCNQLHHTMFFHSSLNVIFPN